MKKRTKIITLSAMLTAISVIIGIFCKSFLNFGGGLFRISFESLPIILSGILFGPFIGATVGAATDLISYFLSAQTYPPNLIVTLGAASLGLFSGLVSHVFIKKRGNAQIIVSGALSHMIGSMLIKPIGLFQFYQWAVLFRIPLYLLIGAIEILLLCVLFKNKSFSKIIDEI